MPTLSNGENCVEHCLLFPVLFWLYGSPNRIAKYWVLSGNLRGVSINLQKIGKKSVNALQDSRLPYAAGIVARQRHASCTRRVGSGERGLRAKLRSALRRSATA